MPHNSASAPLRLSARSMVLAFFLLGGGLIWAVFSLFSGFDAPSHPPRPGFSRDSLVLRTQDNREYAFTVELARTPEEQAYGLMYVRDLPESTGMLFLFPDDQTLSFWMKNTYVPLDMVFLARDGRIINIAANTPPLSLDPVRSTAPGRAVLEIKGGMAEKLGLRPGDRVIYQSLNGF